MDCKAFKQLWLKNDYGGLPGGNPFLLPDNFSLITQVKHIPISIFIANSAGIALLNYIFTQHRLIMC